MIKTLITVLILLLAIFIIYSKDISIILKVVLIICLIISEVLLITML